VFDSVPGSGLAFIAVDFETANHHRASICAIGYAIVRDGEVIESGGHLVQPPEEINWFDGFNVSIHGITHEMVEGQPSLADGLKWLLNKAASLPVLAHNAAFDVGAIRDACTVLGHAWPTIDYACSLAMARRALDLPSYRLPIVCHELGIHLTDHHDAGADALAAAHVVRILAQRRQQHTLDGLLHDLGIIMGSLRPSMWEGCKSTYARVVGPDGTSQGEWRKAPPGANPDADPDHALFGQCIVFTGGLGILRREAWDRVAYLGAQVQTGVNKNTTMLVIGDGFRGNDPREFSTGKAAKAAVWRAKGHAIEVLTEQDLGMLLHDDRTSGVPVEP
jgi:DNA polymerase-3 subunit epsilon